MKQKIIFIHFMLLVVVLINSSCTRNSRMEQFRTFDKNIWERFDYVRFEFEIERVNQSYDAWLVVQYTDDFQGRFLPLHVELITPSGDSRTKDVNVFIRSVQDNSELGVPTNGYREVKTLTHRSLQFFEKGTCSFEIENLNSKYFTYGIHAVGYILEPGKKE